MDYETDVLNSMIRDINAGRDQVINEYWSKIVSEYLLLFKPKIEKTYCIFEDTYVFSYLIELYFLGFLEHS